MRRTFVKTRVFLRLFAAILALSLANQTTAICENVTHENDVTFSIICPTDGSMWVGTASRGLLRVGATGRSFAYSTLTGHLECDSIVSLAFDENGLLWIRDGRDVVLTYSTLEGFVKRCEVPASVRENLFETKAPEVEEPIVCEAMKPVIWPWILVITCLVAAICFLQYYHSRKRNVAPVSSQIPSSKPQEQPVKQAEIEPVEASKETPKEQLTHQGLLFEEGDFESSVKGIIEKNYTDKDFSVDQIATELGISRVHLSRKLKALGAASPSDMIKARRMAAASDMLRSGEKNMAVVATSCGFASAAYFSAAFKAFYGVSPSSFK